jgi:hypothetical protein
VAEQIAVRRTSAESAEGLPTGRDGRFWNALGRVWHLLLGRAEHVADGGMPHGVDPDCRRRTALALLPCVKICRRMSINPPP